MEQVSMNDGLDGRETIAFGLAAGEVAVFVLALLGAYAALRSGVAGPVAWAVATAVAAGGAVLAWGRLHGRPLLEWAVLLARFAMRTRRARVERAGEGAWRLLRALQAAAGLAPRARQAGAVVIPLALRRLEQRSELPGTARGGHVVAFFSLCGGSGRTTLAVEVAALLAVRSRAASATGAAGRRVVLLDLTRRNPSAGLQLGIAPPPAGSAGLVTHVSGLAVGVAAATVVPDDADGEGLGGRVTELGCRSGDIVVVDVDCDLGPLCHDVLRRSDQVLVTLLASAGGVVDAYRSTAVLRRLGLRDRLGYVVNRWRDGFDVTETMADLGGELVAAIPDDPTVVAAGDRHRPAALEGIGAAAAALGRLADAIEAAAAAGAQQAVRQR